MRFRLICLGAWLSCLTIVVAGSARAETPVDFNADIRPLLSSSCFACHGPDEDERAAGLRLDTESGSRDDLGGYAAIVPGDPDASEIIERLITDDQDLRMPPEGKGRRLADDEVELIRRWIREGGNYAKHWSYQLPVRSPLPPVRNTDWPRNAIDHFILARLEHESLSPSPEADRWTLARRLALDLTGLPPTWEEASAFAEDASEDAFDQYVDSLLARSSFGERWAHVWLDLARYADSAGYADDPLRTIWAYRDYVIRSLNENKPFDQFTIEQIAGDLLEQPTDEQLIATAFNRNTLTNNEGGTNDEEFRNVAVVDRVNTTMAVWMGTTMACAQCHTHKFDPITQHEYFQFFAFFNSTEDADRRDEGPLLELWSDEQRTMKQQWIDRIDELDQVLAQSTPQLDQDRSEWLDRLRVPSKWDVLQPQSAHALHRQLNISDDGWVETSGDEPDQDTYSLEFPVNSGMISGLQLEISAAQKSNFVLSQVRAQWLPTAPFSVNARYVRVELPGEAKMIHIAELQAFSGDENLASGGIATQSSTGFGGDAGFANDGITDGDFGKNKTTHTQVEKDPWLEIDLGSTRPIDRVVIWNRTDGSQEIMGRLQGYKLLLLDENHQVVWQQSPPEVPAPQSELVMDGAMPIKFVSAVADFEQAGFAADSLLLDKPDPKQGWAIAGELEKPHTLTLSLRNPLPISDGVIRVELEQLSVHAKHTLDHFRFSKTDDVHAIDWAQMPGEIRQLINKTSGDWTADEKSQVSVYHRSVTPLLAKERKELAQLEKRLRDIKPGTTVPIMRELAQDRRRGTKVQLRGNYLSTGDDVSEGTPAAFHRLQNAERPNRLDLAKWLVDDANPLTARVIANRHWEQLFGTGIVETSEEFGSQGELPTHPELLDWLAVELQESHWDIKRFIKLIVSSATYRQSSVTSDALQSVDPMNRLVARGPRFRVSAEIVRDQALFVSGLLSEKMYGEPVRPMQPQLGLTAAFGATTDWKTSEHEDRYRRGIYTTWRRSNPYPSMAQFDAPNREVCTVRRIRTNTPLQALVTLNDPVYIEAAQSLARRMVNAEESVDDRIRFAFQVCLTRQPTRDETSRLSQLFHSIRDYYATETDEASKMATQPLGPLPAESDRNQVAGVDEYAAWTVVANVILNLDEMLLKR